MPYVHIHQQTFESSSTQTGCPALYTCKMVQGSGRYHLESVELCFGREDLPFPEGYCFALAEIFAAPVFSAPVTAYTAGAAVEGSHSL